MKKTNEHAYKVIFIEQGSVEGKYIVCERDNTCLLIAAMIPTIIKYKCDSDHQSLLRMFADKQGYFNPSSPDYVGADKIESYLDWYQHPDLKSAIKNASFVPGLSDEYVLGGGKYRFNSPDLIFEGVSFNYGKIETIILEQFSPEIKKYCDERNIPLRNISFR